ncbi:MAG: V-type ATP synthase subunit E [Desulfobulbales bacterium]|nr:V-type ATP synthase subunit E [Desulfobulbales bacterium]
MGLQELLDSLRANERQQIDAIWQAAKDEAEKLRQQVDEATAEITKKHAEELDSACQKSMRSIYSETESSVRTKKLFAYNALEQSLKKTAKDLLPALRSENYEGEFAGLVAEIPEEKWEKVVVNSADVNLAAKFFSADIIEATPDISGGLLVTTAESEMVIDNTFEKRLERIWHRILPAIIAKLEQRYEQSVSSQNT